MPQLVVKLGDSVIQNYSFDKDIVNIGRSRDSDITIDNLAVSRSHCRLRKIESNFILTDLNSANGTYVNGVKVTKTEVLDNDIISVGKHKLVFLLEDVKEEEAIGDAFGADRTMIVESNTEGILKAIKGKNKGEEFRITKYETKIGRAADNDIVINDWFVSKSHAKVIKQGDNYILKDLGSWKGSFIGEKLVKDPAPLRDGDELRFGSSRFRFAIFNEKESLALEGRRPEELGYEAPPPNIPDSFADLAPILDDEPPPSAPGRRDSAEVKRTIQLAEVDVPVDDDFDVPFPTGAPSPVEQALDDEEIDFDNLPEPQAARAAIGGVSWEEYEIYAEASGTGWGSVSSLPDEAADDPSMGGAPPFEPPVAVGDFDLPDSGALRHDTPPMDLPVVEQPARAASVAAAPVSAPVSPDGTPSADLARQIELWEKALANKSPIIRRQAAKMLKKLTGRDYDT